MKIEIKDLIDVEEVLEALEKLPKIRGQSYFHKQNLNIPLL